MRGGHPEHHEGGGGWGAPGRSADPRSADPRALDPRFSGVPRPAGYPAPSAAGRIPGPRREYVGAFDDGDVFAAGAAGAAGASGRVLGARTAEQGDGAFGPLGADGFAEESDDEAGTEAESEADRSGQYPPDGPEAARGVAAKGAKGRTFTGIAAAAVTTVLAIVVAGQVAEGPKDSGQVEAKSTMDRKEADDASRSEQRPTPVAKPASYDDLMAQKFPLAPKLQASREFKTVPGNDKALGRGNVLRYRVDVELGLPLDGKLFADAVHKTLNDKRSWGHDGSRTFERVSKGRADFVITLASPGTTATWCAKSGLDTRVDNVSCDSAATERVMINAYRWAQGAETFGDKMHPYRQMLINHEVGHRLGRNHEPCGKEGALAPVMMQQTKTLTTDGDTCKPNSWPNP
ncbi:DUF3152 domain-containing protein [Streptomyces sp. H27-D2]|uniref:DUF3152 domain-containing protein n=1 Tax=Streptomyces sp. H27-D2 TaxID=3046304 RepID=UPI002DBA8BAF|nr:DUF3152 domain-containing protein [Streptomyces sp. H27-D2]MEC4019269.1 DUF3152 domain-containing protein [Streptomyces sp. H27-D2]